MKQRENVEWLRETIYDITKRTNFRNYGKQNIYLDIQLPMCAPDYGYEIGADAILSLNMMGGAYEIIKPGVICGLWFWVSVEGKVVDTVAFYIKSGNPYAELLVSTQDGELAASCIRQLPNVLELFMREYAECNDIPGIQDYFWQKTTGDDFELPLPQRCSDEFDLRKRGVISVPENFLKNLSKKRREARKGWFGGVYSAVLRAPFTFIFSGIGCLMAADIPILMIPLFIVDHLAIAFIITILGFLSDHFTNNDIPECPESLKELAYLYSLGYRLPVESEKETEYKDKKVRFCGFLEEFNEWGISDWEKEQLIAHRKISTSIAKRLGMGEDMNWRECYWRITEQKYCNGRPLAYGYQL